MAQADPATAALATASETTALTPEEQEQLRRQVVEMSQDQEMTLLVCGGRSSGKSTFIQRLLDRAGGMTGALYFMARAMYELSDFMMCSFIIMTPTMISIRRRTSLDGRFGLHVC